MNPQKLTATHRKACAAEHAYNQLSIDMPHLSIAVLAIDAAEMRGKIVREIEELHFEYGLEIPESDSEFHISAAVLDGSESAPNLPLSAHLQSCYQADTMLARAIRNIPELQHYVKSLRESFTELQTICRARFGDTVNTRRASA